MKASYRVLCGKVITKGEMSMSYPLKSSLSHFPDSEGLCHETSFGKLHAFLTKDVSFNGKEIITLN